MDASSSQQPRPRPACGPHQRVSSDDVTFWLTDDNQLVARRMSSGEEVSITLDEALGEGPTSLEGLQGMLMDALEGSAAGASPSGTAPGRADGEPGLDALMALVCGTAEEQHALGGGNSCPQPSRTTQAWLQRGDESWRPAVPGCHLSDWQLAEALQHEEDSVAAAADPLQCQHLADGQDTPSRQSAEDAALARRFQEEEDAALAARLAEQEEAAAEEGVRCPAARSSSSFWSRLKLGGAPAASSGNDNAGPDAFPSLHAAVDSNGQLEATRQLLRRQHRSAKQAAMEAGSGVRLLHCGSPPRSPPRGPASPLSSRTLAWLEQACGQGVEISSASMPPLSLGDGLRLHEDDLDYQLLLRDEGATTAAKAAAESQALRQAGAAASGQALRAMMDATAAAASACRRPGSAPELPTSAAAVDVPGGAHAAPAGVGGTIAAPVDTKSMRRLVDDMRSRGWQILGASAGGHIRCERTFANLPAFKQVYFLCSTPSDRQYVWNVAAAVKRFDRDYEERRAAAAAAVATQAPRAQGHQPGSQPAARPGSSGRRPGSRGAQR